MNFIRIIVGLVGLCGLTVSLVAAEHSVYNYGVQVILSKSMVPTLNLGTLVITRKDGSENYAVGDLITFSSPIGDKEYITHRVNQIKHSSAGPLIETKGDANELQDPWIVPASTIRGKVTGKVPLVGYLVWWVRTPVGFSLVALFSFIGLVWSEIVFMTRYGYNSFNGLKKRHEINGKTIVNVNQ